MTKVERINHKRKDANPAKMGRVGYAERAQQAWNLRVMGYTWTEVTRTLGYATGKSAKRAV